MSASELRRRLTTLQAERLDAMDAGLGDNGPYLRALHRDLAATRAAYVGAAVTEIATLRRQLGRPLVG
jgi:hypothetical protein